MIENSKILWLVLFLSVSLPGTVSFARETDERQRLMERKDRVQARIETLKREQDYLLFQKQMYVSDSKYLLLDLRAGRGELKYRDRILKNFLFSASRAGAKKLPPGVLTLTAKKETGGRKRTLIFGSALIIDTKQKGGKDGKDAKMPRLLLSRKDMVSLFYSLDAGSLAYIVR